MGEHRRAILPGTGLRRLVQFLGPPEERWGTLLVLAILVGLLSGAAAVGLRSAVHYLFAFLAEWRHGLTAVLLPAAGAVLGVAVVRHLFREPPGHGVPEVIHAVCRLGGRLRRRAIFSRWLGSLINVSAGGSAGLESPIVYSAAAIGSTMGGIFHLDERQRSVLLACGVAGGISGIFNAPMTGMIFAMEVVLAEWSAFTIVPVVISSVAGTELSRLILGNQASFLHAPFEMKPVDLGLCVLLGIAAGLLSVVLVSAIRGLHSLGKRVPKNQLVIPVLFGLGVGLLGLWAPGAIGEGYDTAQQAIHARIEGGLGLCLVLLVCKIIASGLTLGSGSPGGVFAPCLVIGSLLGATFARSVARALPQLSLAGEGSYALVGMSGLVAGVMQAPLTGIFLVMEVTGGYDVILPLMIVSVTSLLVAKRFDRYSLYTLELVERGELLRPGTDQRILADIQLAEALDREVTPISEDMTLTEFTQILKTSRHHHFPVLSAEDGAYVGMLDVGSVHEVLLDPELARLTLVQTVMDTQVETVQLDASLGQALQAFERSRAWVLPVLEGRRFCGLLRKSTLFDHYRRELSVQTPE